MSDNEQRRETVADIVAEMRGRSEDGRMDMSLWRDYADRIEAAWKRERAKVESDALSVGGIVEAERHKHVDNAMMRKAILAIKDINDRRPHDADGYELNDIINDMLSEPERTAEKSSAVGNATAMRETLKFIKLASEDYEKYGNTKAGALDVIYDKACAILSAPARNCDRFADELDAQLAFLNEVWLISVDRETMLARDKYENWSDEMRTMYGKWLLAPAAEQKGKAK